MTLTEHNVIPGPNLGGIVLYGDSSRELLRKVHKVSFQTKVLSGYYSSMLKC